MYLLCTLNIQWKHDVCEINIENYFDLHAEKKEFLTLSFMKHLFAKYRPKMLRPGRDIIGNIPYLLPLFRPHKLSTYF
jgi:hypothetical protein